VSVTANGHRVLVVDDEPNIVDVVTMALKFQGFSVESAGTGAQALSAVSSFHPHLIVLDVMLPDMEGFDVAQRLGAQHARVPIIYLTARDATEDKIRGLSLGGDDYVTKPFSLEELVARIRSILRRTGEAEPESSRSCSRTSSSTRTPTRCAAAARSSTSPRPSTACCAT
jgi:two-component system OmpR family response regulator